MSEVPPQYVAEIGAKPAGVTGRIRDAEDLRRAIRIRVTRLAELNAEKAKAIVVLDQKIDEQESRLEELLKLVSVPVTSLPPDAS